MNSPPGRWRSSEEQARPHKAMPHHLVPLHFDIVMNIECFLAAILLMRVSTKSQRQDGVRLCFPRPNYSRHHCCTIFIYRVLVITIFIYRVSVITIFKYDKDTVFIS